MKPPCSKPPCAPPSADFSAGETAVTHDSIRDRGHRGESGILGDRPSPISSASFLINARKVHQVGTRETSHGSHTRVAHRCVERAACPNSGSRRPPPAPAPSGPCPLFRRSDRVHPPRSGRTHRYLGISHTPVESGFRNLVESGSKALAQARVGVLPQEPCGKSKSGDFPTPESAASSRKHGMGMSCRIAARRCFTKLLPM